MEKFADFAYIYDELNVNYDKNKIISRLQQLLCSCREVVDLCCGTGDVAIALAKSGKSVVGVDISEDMLNVATEKAMNSAAKVLFVCSDAREFQLPHKVDAVYSLTDGMNYMIGRDELKKAFCAVNNALKDNGLFVFDISTEYKYEKILADKTFTFDFDDAFAVWQNEYNKSTRICEMSITGFVKKSKNTYYRFDETHFQYCHTLETIEQTLEQAGLALENVYSGYELCAAKQSDERVLIVARKK